MDCALKLRRLLGIRRYAFLLNWLIAAGYLKKTIMLITRLSVIAEASNIKTVASRMMLQLEKGSKELLRLRELVGEVLLLV
jgi:hypothetical protein